MTELVRAALEGRLELPTPRTEEETLREELLTPRREFSAKWLDILQPTIELDPHALSANIAQQPIYDPRVRLHFQRTGLDGRIESIRLAPVPLETLSASSGMAMTRRMGSRRTAVRGRSGQMPFVPGGLDIRESSAASDLHHNEQGLLDIAPGLSRGGKLVSAKSKPPVVSTESLLASDLETAMASTDLSDSEFSSDFTLEDTEDSELDSDTKSMVLKETDSEDDEKLPASQFNDIDALLPPTSSFVRELVSQQSALKKQPQERTWAHMVDINKEITNFDELVPNPARTWPFELDTFQKEAVYRLEQGDSVFIAAHTSAGKTVVAEYAMSMAAQHMTKCIYTSPIKALSNQKYRDFKQEYEDVGILTGDVQLNPDASTLIMTTEILRSMLYRGADIIRDVEFIIFDEVHYVNDSERGVVWEEVIIMLPDHVKLVLLSATVPNTFEFANWVGRTKEKDVYVISTPKRPVPLQHNLWVKNQLIELVGADRKFNTVNYHKAEQLIAPPPPKGPSNGRGGGNSGSSARGGGSNNNVARGGGASRGARGGGRGGKANGMQAMQRQMGPQKGRFNSGTASKTELLSIADYLRSKKLLPAVFFVFSRKMCEQYAAHMQSVSFNTGAEKSQVYMFMDRAVARLRKEDRELPQIKTLRALLQQGIGVHHSGLLPIMKEVVEILFARGLVKMLFATETFAMGLNLPTRTVVFTAVRKFDSKTMRFLSPGEYTQMAGRAGRRGLDSVGTVIIMNTSKDEVIPSSSLNLMMLGTPLKLSSQFRLTYNMILSLLRIEALRVEDVIQQSFSENSQHVLRPEREKKLIALEKGIQDARRELAASQQKLGIEDVVVESLKVYHSAAAIFHSMSLRIYESLDFGTSKSRGRFCFYRSLDNSLLMVGVLFAVRKSRASSSRGAGKSRLENFEISLVSIGIVQDFEANFPFLVTQLGSSRPRPFLSPFSAVKTKTISFTQLEMISAVRVPLNLNLPADEMRTRLLQQYQENVDAVFTETTLNKVSDVEARIALRDRENLRADLEKHAEELRAAFTTQAAASGNQKISKKGAAEIEKIYASIVKVDSAENEVSSIRATATASNTALLPDYEQRLNVLRAANYVDEGLNVALKGRVACEISTGYELYVTELIMDNFLGSYEPEEIVALLSAFVFEGARGAEDPPTVTPRLDEGKARLLELVSYVQQLAIENQVSLTQDEADFAENNRFALMQVVYEWARGMTFSEITTLTTVQEGLIVRVINRLDEVCRSVMSAARIIGEVDLYDKLAIAQERIKRDIVFCSSLYL